VPFDIDPTASFRAAMAKGGLVPPAKVIADGRIHRCNADSKGGHGDGWYVFFNDGIPAGALGVWAVGETPKWCGLSRSEMSATAITIHRSRCVSKGLGRAD
jgi:putative DNA primase/helicase